MTIGGIEAEKWIGRTVRATSHSKGYGARRVTAQLKSITGNGMAIIRPKKHGHDEMVPFCDLYPNWSRNPDLKALAAERRLDTTSITEGIDPENIGLVELEEAIESVGLPELEEYQAAIVEALLTTPMEPSPEKPERKSKLSEKEISYSGSLHNLPRVSELIQLAEQADNELEDALEAQEKAKQRVLLKSSDLYSAMEMLKEIGVVFAGEGKAVEVVELTQIKPTAFQCYQIGYDTRDDGSIRAKHGHMPIAIDSFAKNCLPGVNYSIQEVKEKINYRPADISPLTNALLKYSRENPWFKRLGGKYDITYRKDS